MKPEDSAQSGDVSLSREDYTPIPLSRVFAGYAVLAGLLTLLMLGVRACDHDGETRYAVPDIEARKAALSATDR